MVVSDGETGTPPLEQLRDCLLDRSQPIAKRTHSAFFLRTLGTAEAVSAVGEGNRGYLLYFVMSVAMIPVEVLVLLHRAMLSLDGRRM